MLKNWIESLGILYLNYKTSFSFFKKLLSSKLKENNYIPNVSKMELKHTNPNNNIVLENILPCGTLFFQNFQNLF